MLKTPSAAPFVPSPTGLEFPARSTVASLIFQAPFAGTERLLRVLMVEVAPATVAPIGMVNGAGSTCAPPVGSTSTLTAAIPDCVEVSTVSPVLTQDKSKSLTALQ